MNNKPQMIIC